MKNDFLEYQKRLLIHPEMPQSRKNTRLKMEAENVVEPVVEEQPKGPQVSAQPTTVVTGATAVTVGTVPELFDTGLRK